MTNDESFTKVETQEANAILELCEKLGLLKLTEISVELDKRFEEHLDYLNKYESLSVKDLDHKNMNYVLISYFKKNHESERELIKWMDRNKNYFETEIHLHIISQYMSEMLDDLELGNNVIPDDLFEKWKTETGNMDKEVNKHSSVK